MFLQQEAGAFGNNMGKEPQKPRPKMKNMYIIYLLRIFALPAIQRKWQFFANMYQFCRKNDAGFLTLKVAVKYNRC